VTVARRGDTIQVAPGDYHEDVVITKGVAVVAAHRASVVANGFGNGFEIKGRRAAGAVIQGFTVKGALFEGILVESTSRLVISDNTVTGNNLGARSKNTTGECAGHGNVPGDCGEGIHLMGVTHSLVGDNTVTGNEGGILLTDETGPSAHNTISRNHVHRNPQDCGITIAGHNSKAFDGSPHPKLAGIYDNTVIENVSDANGTLKRDGGGAGILLAAGGPGTAVYGNTIRDNVAVGNGLAGITLHTHTPNVDIDGNKILGNTLAQNGALGDAEYGEAGTVGILIGSAVVHPTGIAVKGNKISDVHFGIYTKNVPPLTGQGNTFRRVAVPLMQI